MNLFSRISLWAVIAAILQGCGSRDTLPISTSSDTAIGSEGGELKDRNLPRTTVEPARNRRKRDSGKRREWKARRRSAPDSHSVTGESWTSARSSDHEGFVSSADSSMELKSTFVNRLEDPEWLADLMKQKFGQQRAREVITPTLAKSEGTERAIDALQRMGDEYMSRLHLSWGHFIPDWDAVRREDFDPRDLDYVAQEVRAKLLSLPMMGPSCALTQLSAFMAMDESSKKRFLRTRFSDSVADSGLCLPGQRYQKIVDALERELKPDASPPMKEIQETVNLVYTAFAGAAGKRMRFDSTAQFDKLYPRRAQKVVELMRPHTV